MWVVGQLCKRSLFTCCRLGSSMIMDSSSGKAVVAVCQMTANNVKEDNLKTCESLITRAKRFQAQVVFLPEACDYIGETKAETIDMAEYLDGVNIQAFKEMARQNSIWLSLGGVHEKVNDTTVRNTHLVIDSDGNIAASYSKLHLFDVDYPAGRVLLKESSYCQPGRKIVSPVPTPAGKLGLAICYDMRFPELSLCLRSLGADILSYPSAFTFATGAAHWEVLLRARAIESQCYVIAAAQTGHHNKKRSSWGHAMIVDPWGSVVAQCSEGTNIAIAEIDLSLVHKTRLSMPVVEHRRNDLYPAMKPLTSTSDCHTTGAQQTIYQFGQASVKESCVFFKTALTIAFTNKKCVVPGHVLVAPIRSVLRLCELTSEEVSDLFQVVQKVEKVVEPVHKSTASTIAVQDGEDAGQTIKHVHVHILPRRPGDFTENDDIYRELQKHDKTPSNSEWRTEEEMSQEADFLRRKMCEVADD